MKVPFIQFSDWTNGWWGTTPCTWNLGPNWSVSSKTPIFSLFSLVAA